MDTASCVKLRSNDIGRDLLRPEGKLCCVKNISLKKKIESSYDFLTNCRLTRSRILQ